jgi:hypothetical protein
MSSQQQQDQQNRRQSTAQRYSQQSPTDQIRRWEQRCEVIHSIVKEQLESISEAGDVFDQQDLYPAVPLLIAQTWTTLLGFSPEKLVESSVMTEALFERLPSSVASGVSSAIGEFAGARS